jgi:hypothetical protein
MQMQDVGGDQPTARWLDETSFSFPFSCAKIFDVSYAHMFLMGLSNAYAQKRQVVLLVHLDFKGLCIHSCQGQLYVGLLDEATYLRIRHVDAHLEMIKSGMVWGRCRQVLVRVE